MDNMVYRFYVEKRQDFDVPAKSVQGELSGLFDQPDIAIRIFNRYDIQNLTSSSLQPVIDTVLSEPMSDFCYEESLPPFSHDTRLLYVESLPGQFDIRADSCQQCIELLLGCDRPVVRTALVYAIEGVEDDTVFDRIKTYLINPVECREASPDKPASLTALDISYPGDIQVIDRFIKKNADALDTLKQEFELAMSLPDILFVQEYFRRQHRNPTQTELKVIDTYWSDHCRHTTFNTLIEDTDIRDERVAKAFDMFSSVNGERPVTLMNIATAAMRYLRKTEDLPMLDESDEVNACTVRVTAESDRGAEEWLLFFKNETHNHPTEIEPFGGAATCIGGAIRDPLSGRAYVYQAMRLSGSGDPRRPIEETLPGKLPQRKITTTAAAGFSSYGNQIGLATGHVKELYHEGYVAKRLEAGAVVGAVPRTSVRRERPIPGDIVVLLGGRTGRDGIGGATGSSKTHNADTVSERASEVQKGNAPEERKLQRLFRNPAVTVLIKKSNDFGAGGAAVAIGELADGVEITLDNIPVKYEGMDGTELAISESQERIAVVLAQGDLTQLKRHAETENIEASVVACITERSHLVMKWRGKTIVDINRAFLDTNGTERRAAVFVPDYKAQNDNNATDNQTLSLRRRLLELCGDLNFCSQKGLVERFDSSIGSGSVFAPYGGKYALTETQVMAALLPIQGTEGAHRDREGFEAGKQGSGNRGYDGGAGCDVPVMKTASVMAYGFDPHFTEADPFLGSVYAVVSSGSKLAAAGVSLDTVHLSLQEYFPSLGVDPKRWGQPFAAMLGAFSAQLGLKIAAIGGKDSMSGSFKDLDVPPTLISFAVGVNDASKLISPEFKRAGNPVYLLETPMDCIGAVDYAALRDTWDRYIRLCRTGKVLSAWSCETGGVYGGIMKMAFGNMIGFSGCADEKMFENHFASIIFEAGEELGNYRLLGYTQAEPSLTFGDETATLLELCEAWQNPLEGIFPTKIEHHGSAPFIRHEKRPAPRTGAAFAKPRAVLPVFPGTNCEYDTAAAIERAGGIAEVVLIRNLTPNSLKDSVSKLSKVIASAQMLIFPGGFSGGDEPDGSGKYIVSLFRNARLSEAVLRLLFERDGLIMGICNGFQALIKLGLLPFGQISAMNETCPTLTFNRIGRHQARYVNTRVSSVMTPWLSKCSPGEVYVQPVSHGEGRLTARADILETMKKNGQIVFQYTDNEGTPSMDIAHNPNGSIWAIEGLCSPDGRILGKMAHTERHGEFVARNIPGNKYMPLFEGGIDYFK